MTINSFFIIYKGAKGLGLDKTDIGVALGSSFGIGIGSALLTIPLVPYLKKYINNKLKNNSLSEEKNNVEMTLSNEIVGQQDRLNIKSEELNRIVQLHEKAENLIIKQKNYLNIYKYLLLFATHLVMVQMMLQMQ